MRQETIETLKGNQLILHFDGKIVEQQQEICEGGMMVDCEGIAVSVTSPQFGDNGDLLLGVVLSDSSKGSDQAYNILSLLECYEICDQIFAIILCCDTTSSNTGVHNGTVQILSTTLNAQMLWLMCRHHIYEVHISHFMKALTGQKTKGPRRQFDCRRCGQMLQNPPRQLLQVINFVCLIGVVFRLDQSSTVWHLKPCSLGKGPWSSTLLLVVTTKGM